MGGGREENRTFHQRGGAELSGMGEKKGMILGGRKRDNRNWWHVKQQKEDEESMIQVEFYREHSVILSLLFIATLYLLPYLKFKLFNL